VLHALPILSLPPLCVLPYMWHTSQEHSYRTVLSRGKALDWTRGALGYNLAQTSAIMTEVPCGFPQFLQTNTGMVPGLGYHRFLPNSFRLVTHHTIQLYIVSMLKKCH
jgi:hypothetical protein